jgi:hypothetical protein
MHAVIESDEKYYRMRTLPFGAGHIGAVPVWCAGITVAHQVSNLGCMD